MRWQSIVTTLLQVLLATSINRAGTSKTFGMAMRYLRRPGNLCQPSYYQMGVSTPSSAPTSLKNNEGQLLTRAETMSQRKKRN